YLTNLYTYAVFRTDVQKDQSLFWESLSGGWNTNRFNLHNPWSDNTMYYDAGNVVSGNRVSGAWGGTYGTYNIWALQSSTSTSTPSGQNQAMYRDGKMLFTNTGTTTFAGANQPFDLGRQEPIASNYFNGSLAELIVFTTPVNPAQHKGFQSYLAVKYGITLDQSTLQDYFASDGTTIIYPTSSDLTYNSYKYGIAGIGRDDLLYQNQKQSKSYNTNDIVTIALGAVATTNAANFNTFSADKSFMLWGNDNGPLKAQGQTDFNSAVLQGRIGRIWHVKETGTINTVRIQADFSSFYGPGGVTGTNDLSNTRLLVDADGIFAVGATTISPTSYNNGTGLAQFDVDFTTTNGYYFTFGTTNVTNTPLPVHVYSFDANKNGSSVQLVWKFNKTSQASTFKILYSKDALNWESLAVVSEKSSAEGIQTAEYLDDMNRTGVNYYRIIQIYSDGSQNDLGTRMVNMVYKDALEWNIFPNPNSGHFQLIVKGGISDSSVLEVCDIYGKSVFSQLISNSISEIQMGEFPKGTYLAKLGKEGQVQIQRIVIQ
ncbi:MAG: T9SS type A sorting domain-containing protein, partial [Cytophagales bacterium]|nr:T9SS type A sorting domain-containing protein [Cytophagales bacterium]